MDDTTARGDAPPVMRTSPGRRRIGRGRAAALAGGTALLAGLGGGTYAVVAGASGVSSTPVLDAATTAPSAAPRPVPAAHGRWGWRGGVAGLITSIGSSSLTVQRPDGTTVQVTVTSATTYRSGTTALTLDKLSAGEDVLVVPTSATAGSSTPTAASVRVVGPVIAGRVVSVSGSTVVVSDPQGFYRTVITSSATTVTGSDGKASSLAAVQPNTRIAALGAIAADHTDLDATAIRILPAMPTGPVPGPMGPGGPMGPRGGWLGGFGGPGGGPRGMR